MTDAIVGLAASSEVMGNEATLVNHQPHEELAQRGRFTLRLPDIIGANKCGIRLRRTNNRCCEKSKGHRRRTPNNDVRGSRENHVSGNQPLVINYTIAYGPYKM